MAGLTRNQVLVLEGLKAREAPQSAYDLLDVLRAQGLKAPPQVYRALDRLCALGLAHRIESLNAYVACAHPEEVHPEGDHAACHDHHDEGEGVVAFAICETCGGVIEFSDASVCEALAGWCRQSGFDQAHTTLEITGTCAACRDPILST
ncbi:MAG: Fur family transcriptional regulator [Rhodospirillales bacterium]